MIRVALVADTHGMLDERIAEIVADCDLVVHAGDIGAPRVLAALQPKSGRVMAVRTITAQAPF
ncbi:MAG: metallophosphoesterase family protein [Halothiobacillaceae bacterium]